MKATGLTISAKGTIGLTEDEISILHHVTSYGNKELAEIISKRSSEKYTAEEISKTLDEIQSTTAELIYKAGKAKEYVFEDRYTSRAREITIGGSNR